MVETIGYLAAKIYQNKDWHRLSADEKMLVAKLEETGYIEKKKIPDGFVGKSVYSSESPRVPSTWPFPPFPDKRL